MGALDLVQLRASSTYSGEISPRSWLYVLNVESDGLARVFSDNTFLEMQGNPVCADSNGNFPPIHLVPGMYNIEVRDNSKNKSIFRADNIFVGSDQISDVAYSVRNMAELLEKASITYNHSAPIKNKVRLGDTVQVTDGPFFFTVADETARDDNLKTREGVKLYPRAINGSTLTPVQFGCRRDGITDDGDNLAACFQYAQRNGYSVELGAGSYRIDARTSPLWAFDRGIEGARNGMFIRGQGPTLTTLDIRGDVSSFLFDISGDKSEYGAPHASWIDFENFGISGNGNRVDLFSFVCADRVNIRNFQAYNCDGYGIYAREWWDSSLDDVSFVRCGSGGADGGTNRAVIDFDWFFEFRSDGTTGAKADSACNDIDFKSGVQIEEYRFQAMRLGEATRRFLFAGKVHYWIGRNYTVPAVYADGPSGCRFIGASFTHLSGDGTPLRAVLIDGGNGYQARRNTFMGNNMSFGIELSGDVGNCVIQGNIMDNGTAPAVLLTNVTGPGNSIFGNVPQGTGPEVEGRTSFNSRALRVPALHAGLAEPTDGWANRPIHGYDATLDNVALFESGDFSAFVQFKDGDTTNETRIGVQGNNLKI